MGVDVDKGKEQSEEEGVKDDEKEAADEGDEGDEGDERDGEGVEEFKEYADDKEVSEGDGKDGPDAEGGHDVEGQDMEVQGIFISNSVPAVIF
ncbi:hypothetical protein EON65_07840 [archaeon]|nr:MAG: hypothetical protein EON65_07840 [archaeon]